MVCTKIFGRKRGRFKPKKTDAAIRRNGDDRQKAITCCTRHEIQDARLYRPLQKSQSDDFLCRSGSEISSTKKKYTKLNRTSHKEKDSKYH